MKIQVLIVEDDAMIRAALTDILPIYGEFEVTTAVDGVDALEKLGPAAAPRPQIVLTDLKMPRMDGRELLKALRARGYDGPVALMTGFVAGVDTAGFDAVFHKPFAMADLARDLAALAAK